MKFETDDKIILLHSGERGIIVEVISAEMALVEVDGIQFPVYLDQIDFPYFHDFTSAKQKVSKNKLTPGEEIKKEKPQPFIHKETGAWLSFLPIMEKADGEEIISALKLFLVNETNAAYQFEYELYFSGKLSLSIKNNLSAFSHFYLHDIDFDQLNDSPSFNCSFHLKEPAKGFVEEYERALKLKAKQLFQHLEKTQAQQDASFRLLWFETYPEKKPPEFFDLQATQNIFSSPAQPTAEEPKQEVDLHIESLDEDFRGLSNFEILTIQLNEFKKYLQLAIAHRQSSMIVIHGIGKGKLKDEVHEILRQTPEVGTFVNQYHPRYGFGATEIFFSY